MSHFICTAKQHVLHYSFVDPQANLNIRFLHNSEWGGSVWLSRFSQSYHIGLDTCKLPSNVGGYMYLLASLLTFVNNARNRVTEWEGHGRVKDIHLFVLCSPYPCPLLLTLPSWSIFYKSLQIKQLTIGSYISVRSSRYEAHAKFGEHERCVRVARGVAKSNFSYLSALQASQVLHISMKAQMTNEPIVL